VPRPFEIKSDTDFRSELADAAYQALLQISAREALGDRLKAFTGLLRGFKVGASSDGSVEFSFDPDAVSGSTGDLEWDLISLFEELGQTAREHDTGIVFLIDEMQLLARDELEAVAMAMHRMSQRTLPVALVGTGLPQLPGLMLDAKSYAERLFVYPRLGSLSEDAARQALVEPAHARDVAGRRTPSHGSSASPDAIPRSSRHTAGWRGITPRARRSAPATFEAPRRSCSQISMTSSSTPASRRPRTRAAIHGRDGRPRRGPLPHRSGRQTSRQATVLHLGPTRLTHQEVPDLQPPLWPDRLHRPKFSPFMRRRYPLERGLSGNDDESTAAARRARSPPGDRPRGRGPAAA